MWKAVSEFHRRQTPANSVSHSDTTIHSQIQLSLFNVSNQVFSLTPRAKDGSWLIWVFYLIVNSKGPKTLSLRSNHLLWCTRRAPLSPGPKVWKISAIQFPVCPATHSFQYLLHRSGWPDINKSQQELWLWDQRGRLNCLQNSTLIEESYFCP